MPSNWEPPEGFRKAGVLVRNAHYEKILTIASRSGKRPWEVIDALLGRGLEGIEIPPPITLENLLKKPAKKK